MCDRDKSGSRWYESIDSFFRTLKEAPLLSKCGGPYPDNLRLRPVSLDQALDVMSGIVLDINPSCALHGMLLDAGRRADALARSGWMRALTTFLYVGKRRLLEDTTDKAARIVFDLCEDWPDKFEKEIFVSEYLRDFFVALSGLVAMGAIDEFPKLITLTDLIFAGFLPVDIEESDDEFRILVH